MTGNMLKTLLPWVLIVHCILLLGMFDVYFKSPIIPDLPPVPTTFSTPAKRLVLFIGDGLRADHFFDTCNVPYLRHLIESGEAVAGISHARVPTESRPGTVAIAAGVYEDPSAVFKGWQDNPVPVDSFFNRCKYSFAWGSPDIVHLFSRGGGNIDARSYNEEEQKFDPQVSLTLNKWVLIKFKKFIQDCRRNATCVNIIQQDKISFLFHFIGIDMAGHKSKPFSESYIENIKLVDKITEEIVAIFNEVFKDDKTSFVFTSDHGMTNWGSHGTGFAEETKTPLVAWGSGVKRPPLVPNEVNDPSCQWIHSFDEVYDVHQADIAVLMSTLLGTEIPTNSMGTVPVAYLDFDFKTLSSAVLLNINQLRLLFSHLENMTKGQVLGLFFRPFTFGTMDVTPVEYLGIFDHMISVNHSHSEDETRTVLRVLLVRAELIKKGINYYQTYFQTYLLGLLTFSFLGLIFIIAGKVYVRSTSKMTIADAWKKRQTLYESNNRNTTVLINQIFVVTIFIVSVLHIVQSLPFSYYIYAILPILLWWKVFVFWSSTMNVSNFRFIEWRRFVKIIMLLSVGIQLMYLSFFYRWILAIMMSTLSAFPFIIEVDKKLHKTGIFWTVSSLVLSIFPLLPTVGVAKHTILVVASGCSWLLIVAAMVKLTRHSSIAPQISSSLTKFQIVMMVVAIFTVVNVDFGPSYLLLSFPLKMLSWLILILNSLVLFYLPRNPRARLFNMSVAFGIPFMMLSISFESLFLPILTINMMSWYLLELGIIQSEERLVSSRSYNSSSSLIHEVRNGFFFLFLIIFSFFGIGNIDSLNSFDINWVRCFIEVFSPFTMTALIVLKTVMPFFLVSCTLKLIVSHTKVDGVNILLIAIVLCELMGLLFLFKVRNTGSWLDIGKSISHYIIMEVSSFCLVILYSLSGYLIDPCGSRN